MRQLRNMLVSIAAAGIGQVAAAGSLADCGVPASMRSLPYSYAQVHALTTGAQLAVLTAVAPGILPDGNRAALAPPPPAAAARQAIAREAYPIVRRELRPGRSLERAPWPMDTAPEPTGWMTLLCGFIGIAFIARRRAGSDPD